MPIRQRWCLVRRLIRAHEPADTYPVQILESHTKPEHGSTTMNRTTSIAAAILSTVGLAAVGCSSGGGSSSNSLSTAAPLPQFGSVVLVGTFEGQDNFVAEGNARIIESKGRHFVALDESFNVGRARSATLCFGNDGAYDEFTVFTVVEERSGSQVYRVPVSIDPTMYNELYIFSDRRNGQVIGVAELD